jgi:hypothetical protein
MSTHGAVAIDITCDLWDFIADLEAAECIEDAQLSDSFGRICNAVGTASLIRISVPGAHPVISNNADTMFAAFARALRACGLHQLATRVTHAEDRIRAFLYNSETIDDVLVHNMNALTTN